MLYIFIKLGCIKFDLSTQCGLLYVPHTKRKKIIVKSMVFSKICTILKLNMYMSISKVSTQKMESKNLKL